MVSEWGIGGKDKRTMNEYAVERLLDALQSLTFELQLFREVYVANNSPKLERIDEPQTENPCDGCVCDDGKHLMYCMNCKGIAWKTEPPKVEDEPQTKRSE